MLFYRSFFLMLERKADRKFSAPPGPARNVDLSFMLINDIITYSESEPRPPLFKILFGGKERLEYPREIRFRNADTRVREFKNKMRFTTDRSNIDRSPT